jgi:hypothetical protein
MKTIDQHDAPHKQPEKPMKTKTRIQDIEKTIAGDAPAAARKPPEPMNEPPLKAPLLIRLPNGDGIDPFEVASIQTRLGRGAGTPPGVIITMKGGHYMTFDESSDRQARETSGCLLRDVNDARRGGSLTEIAQANKV